MAEIFESSNLMSLQPPVAASKPKNTPEKTTSSNINVYALASCFLASMTCVLLGYDIGVMSGAIIYIQQDFHISDVQKEVMMGILNLYSLLGSAAAGRTSDWIGRRYTILMAGAMFFLGLTIMNRASHGPAFALAPLCVACVVFFVISFSTGMGAIPWVYNSEIFPLRLRAQGCSIGVVVNRVTSGVTCMTFITLYKSITIGGAFFMYAGITAVGWVFIYCLLPETQGRMLEEMEQLFDRAFVITLKALKTEELAREIKGEQVMRRSVNY